MAYKLFILIFLSYVVFLVTNVSKYLGINYEYEIISVILS